MKKTIFFLVATGFIHAANAQSTKSDSYRIDSSKYVPLTTFTTQQDHDNMKQQLGIKKLRPGKSGNESDPNHANYDESLANPCPQLPDILTTKGGEKGSLG